MICALLVCTATGAALEKLQNRTVVNALVLCIISGKGETGPCEGDASMWNGDAAMLSGDAAMLNGDTAMLNDGAADAGGGSVVYRDLCSHQT